MMKTTQSNWTKKNQQHQQPSTDAAKSRPQSLSQLLLPPPPLPTNKNINDHMTKNKQKKKNKFLSEQELKLAAIAINLNVRLRTSDMPVSMQEHALRYTRSLIPTATTSDASLPLPQRLSPTLLARSLKKEFDGLYGPAWHCVVGKSFGSFVTHSAGGFVYFSLDSLSFLLFKTEVQLVN